MRRSGNTFGAEIPASATSGNLVAYYIEAEDEDEDTVASAGSEDCPFTISLSGGGGGDDDDDDDDDDEDGDEDDGGAAGPPIYLSLMGGLGVGYATGNGEINADNKVNPAGFAPSSAGQVVLEGGYFISPALRLSAQVRLQFVSGPTPVDLTKLGRTGCGSDNICSPVPTALAAFARASWFFGSGTSGPTSRWRSARGRSATS